MAVRRAWSRSESSRAAFSSTAAQRPRMSGEGAAPAQLTQPRTLSASLPVSEVTSPAAPGPTARPASAHHHWLWVLLYSQAITISAACVVLDWL